MSDALLVSHVVLWIVVLVLAGVVLALARQIGILYERVAPAGALAIGQGPAVGDPAPAVSAVDLQGAAHVVGGERADGLRTLLFFLSPACPVCKSLLPVLRSLVRTERRLRLVLASEGTREDHVGFVAEHALDGFPYLLSPELGVTYRVPKLPYAVLLDATGVIRSKGLVNSREHLESLLEADERGVGSIQDFLRDRERSEAAS